MKVSMGRQNPKIYHKEVESNEYLPAEPRQRYKKVCFHSWIDNLPTVTKCCYFFDLKGGSVLIALIGILTQTAGIYPLIHLRECFEIGSDIKLYAYDGVRFYLFVDGCQSVSCLIFLFGICFKWAITATLYIYMTLLKMILCVLISFLISIFIKFDAKLDCYMNYLNFVSHSILWLCLSVYFIIVVKNYRSELIRLKLERAGEDG